MSNLDTVFKAYDIRGKVPEQLNAELSRRIGVALAQYLPVGAIAVGRDMRAESAELAQALMAGLLSQGRAVVNLDLCTSDIVYFAVGSRRLAGAAMITASHIGAGTNGVKLVGPKVASISAGSGLDTIKNLVRQPAARLSLAHTGEISQLNLTAAFVKHAISVSQNSYGTLGETALGYDAGNGMAGIFLPALQKQTALKISGLYTTLDGSFPNHPANPMQIENLADVRALVRQHELDVGVAFDGDGDRAFLVDEKGQPISSSILGALLVQRALARQPKATIVYSALCSRIVPETIQALGGKAVICRPGHNFIKEKMDATQALLGVEHSGHFYFADNYRVDSGLIAALSGLAILSAAQQPLSQLVKPYQKYFNSQEINFAISASGRLFRRLWDHYQDGQISEIDGLSISYPNWWFNLRLSNTEPLMRLNIEATSAELLDAKQAELIGFIHLFS